MYHAPTAGLAELPGPSEAALVRYVPDTVGARPTPEKALADYHVADTFCHQTEYPVWLPSPHCRLPAVRAAAQPLPD